MSQSIYIHLSNGYGYIQLLIYDSLEILTFFIFRILFDKK